MNKYLKILCVYLLSINNTSYTMEDINNKHQIFSNDDTDYIKYLEEENNKLSEKVDQLSIQFNELQKICLQHIQINKAKKELDYLIQIKPNNIRLDINKLSQPSYCYKYIINYMDKLWLQNNNYLYTQRYENSNSYYMNKNVYEHDCDSINIVKDLLKKEENGIIKKLTDDKKIFLYPNNQYNYFIISDSIVNLLYYNEKLSIYVNDYCTQYLPKLKYFGSYISEVLKNFSIYYGNIYKNNKNNNDINKIKLLHNNIKELYSDIDNVNKTCNNIRKKLKLIIKVKEDFINKFKYLFNENIQVKKIQLSVNNTNRLCKELDTFKNGQKLKSKQKSFEISNNFLNKRNKKVIENITEELNMLFSHIYDWRNKFSELEAYLNVPENLYINIGNIDSDKKVIDKNEELESRNNDTLNLIMDDLYQHLNNFEKEMKIEIQQLQKIDNLDKKYTELYDVYDEVTQILNKIIIN